MFRRIITSTFIPFLSKGAEPGLWQGTTAVAFVAPSLNCKPAPDTPALARRGQRLMPSHHGHRARHHRQGQCPLQRPEVMRSTVLSLSPSMTTLASESGGWQPRQRRTRRRPWTTVYSGGGSSGDGSGSSSASPPAGREATDPGAGPHGGRGDGGGRVVSMTLGTAARETTTATETKLIPAQEAGRVVVETGSRGTQGGDGRGRRSGVDGGKDEGEGTRAEKADGEDGAGAPPGAARTVAETPGEGLVAAAAATAPAQPAETEAVKATAEASAGALTAAAGAPAPAPASRRAVQEVAVAAAEPKPTPDEPPQPAAVEKEEGNGKDGFGEHGWFSPMSEVEDGVGSVFSWSTHADAGSRSGHVHSSEKAGPSREGNPKSAEASGGRREIKEGPREDKEQDGSNDNFWSERRRLVEDWEEYDEVWFSMRQEAKAAAEKEPLLVSFVYSTILNQKTLEAAVAFHLANKLAGPHMLSTQVQALVREYFADESTPYRRNLRRDIIAVRERDPACDSYHDCLLYFKGFQALQTHRVAHWLYNSGRHALAFYLQSQVNQEFQIDIHPGAKFGEGVFIDHGTGIVVGETAVVGNDVSMLHRVTLGGSGVKSADRHPKIGDGVLIGAGACLLGNIRVGKGTQIGAGSLVVTDLPERCVAVGVPAKVLGQGKNRKPALAMDQDCFKEVWRGLDI